MTNTAVAKKVHPNGDVTLTNTLDGSTEFKTKEQMKQNRGKESEDGKGQHPKGKKRG